MDEDFEPSKSLAEKRRRYFEKRDKFIAEKKGFRRIDVDTGPQGPQFLMVLLCVLGIALVVFKAFGPRLFGTEAFDVGATYTPDSSASESTNPGVRIDPEPMQSQLIRLEASLFSPDNADSLELVLIGAKFELDRVTQLLKDSSDPRQGTAGEDLELLASELSNESSLEELEAFKGRWLQLRSQHFQHASWFRKGSSGQQSSVSYTLYRESANDLVRMIGQGLDDMEDTIRKNEQIGTLEVNREEREQLASEWREVVSSWSSELRRIRSKVPRRPDNPPSNEALTAMQQLSSALRACDNLLPDNLPSESHLQGLEAALLRAQFASEALGQLN